MGQFIFSVYEIEHEGDLEDATDTLAEIPEIEDIEVLSEDFEDEEAAQFKVSFKDEDKDTVRQAIKTSNLCL